MPRPGKASYFQVTFPREKLPRETGYFTCGFDDLSGKYDGRAEQMQEAWHTRFVLSRAELARAFRP
jgi:hypothetical protein